MTRSSASASVAGAEVAMPVLRKVVDEKHARVCLAAIAKSREPLRDWARKNQIDGRSLRAWQLNLSRARRDDETSACATGRARAGVEDRLATSILGPRWGWLGGGR
jgi:hypothetical protein